MSNIVLKNENKVYQLALQGGGAKGAYHVGFLKALFENNFKFNAVVGASVGAIVAAMIAQNDFEKLYNIWENLSFSDVINVDDYYAEKLAKNEFNKQTILYALKCFKDLYKTKGLETDKIKNIINLNVDEKKLRESDIEFGLVTVKINLKKIREPIYLFKNDIEEGKLNDYIMASARLPGFQKHVIDNDNYIDGGIYDNLPITMLIEKGYKNILAIRCSKDSLGKEKKIDKNNLKYVTYIEPSEKPGRVLDFSPESIKRGIKIGYFDGLKFINKLYGENYYILKFEKDEYLEKIFLKINNEILSEVEKEFGIENKNLDKYDGKIFRMYRITKLISKLISKKTDNFLDMLIYLLEFIAKKFNVDRLQLFDFEDFIKLISFKINNIDNTLQINNKENKIFVIYKKLEGCLI